MPKSAHARCQKGGIPEETKIGRSITPFQNESTEGKLKKKARRKRKKEKEEGRKKTVKRRARRARPTLNTQALTPDRPPQAEITGI